MIRSPAGYARHFSRRVGRHCRRTAGLSSETRRRLIRRGSLGLAVLRLRPSRRGASATDARLSRISQIEFLKFAASFRDVDPPLLAPYRQPAYGRGGRRCGRRCLGTRTGY